MTQREVLIEIIRNAVIEANSKGEWFSNADIAGGPIEASARPVRLADVLYAIGDKKIDDDADAEVFYRGTAVKVLRHWNLRQDDLTGQSDECITFLAGLLQ